MSTTAHKLAQVQHEAAKVGIAKLAQALLDLADGREVKFAAGHDVDGVAIVANLDTKRVW